MIDSGRSPSEEVPAAAPKALVWTFGRSEHEVPLAAASTGRWLVTTESGSVHLLDLDQGLAARFRTMRSSMQGQAALRRDGEDLPLISVVATVGRSMVLMLALRGDGVLTLRQTTPVLAIERAEVPGPSAGAFEGS